MSLGPAGGAVQLEWLMPPSGDLGTPYADSIMQAAPALSAINSAFGEDQIDNFTPGPTAPHPCNRKK
jgi:hypothetical protein